MRKIIVNGLAIVGGACIAKEVTKYILRTYRKEIKAAVMEKTVSYFFDEETENEKETDPLKVAFLAYLDARKGASK